MSLLWVWFTHLVRLKICTNNQENPQIQLMQGFSIMLVLLYLIHFSGQSIFYAFGLVHFWLFTE